VITVVVTARQAGTLTTGDGLGHDSDSNAANNTATASTTVTAPPTCPWTKTGPATVTAAER